MKTKIDLTCPKCEATLSVNPNRDFLFCEYCGAKILLNDENTYTIRHVDEAKIKQAETEQIVRLKQLEIAERKAANRQKNLKLKIKLSLILAVVGALLMVVGNLAGPESSLFNLSFAGYFPFLAIFWIWILHAGKEDSLEDTVKVPTSIDGYSSKNYSAIEAILKNAGFKNIKCIPLNDLTIGFLKKPGMVESITINGHEVTSGGKKFPTDASVVISYHSMAK